MQLGKQQGHNKAIARRSCGAALKFHLFRILMVAGTRSSRMARAKVKKLHSFRAKFRIRQQAKTFRCKHALQKPRRARMKSRETAINPEKRGWP